MPVAAVPEHQALVRTDRRPGPFWWASSIQRRLVPSTSLSRGKSSPGSAAHASSHSVTAVTGSLTNATAPLQPITQALSTRLTDPGRPLAGPFPIPYALSPGADSLTATDVSDAAVQSGDALCDADSSPVAAADPPGAMAAANSPRIAANSPRIAAGSPSFVALSPEAAAIPPESASHSLEAAASGLGATRNSLWAAAHSFGSAVGLPATASMQTFEPRHPHQATAHRQSFRQSGRILSAQEDMCFLRLQQSGQIPFSPCWKWKLEAGISLIIYMTLVQACH